MSPSDLQVLYRRVVLDHYRSPRNLRRQGAWAHRAEAANPLCGDRLCVYLTLEDEQLRDVSFDGVGCALCIASASLMTEVLHGTTQRRAEAVCTAFGNLMTPSGAAADEEALGQLTMFAALRQHPMRIPCAMLAWSALQTALAHGETAG